MCKHAREGYRGALYTYMTVCKGVFRGRLYVYAGVQAWGVCIESTWGCIEESSEVFNKCSLCS